MIDLTVVFWVILFAGITVSLLLAYSIVEKLSACEQAFKQMREDIAMIRYAVEAVRRDREVNF